MSFNKLTDIWIKIQIICNIFKYGMKKSCGWKMSIIGRSFDMVGWLQCTLKHVDTCIVNKNMDEWRPLCMGIHDYTNENYTWTWFINQIKILDVLTSAWSN